MKIWKPGRQEIRMDNKAKISEAIDIIKKYRNEVTWDEQKSVDYNRSLNLLIDFATEHLNEEEIEVEDVLPSKARKSKYFPANGYDHGWVAGFNQYYSDIRTAMKGYRLVKR